MADTTFTNGTLIVPDWLNDVNRVVYKDKINVRNYGATGNGVTDDTAALQTAAAALQSGQSLYFPAGTYIVSAPILIRGKSNFSVFGDGKSSIIRPANQGPTGVKQDYPSTLAIDQSTNFTAFNLVVESKGENYGNTDAYGGLSGGDPRTNATINFGGQALVIARSSTFSIINIDARYCGSVGVIYLSSCQDAWVIDCFVNAKSLGYAGVAIDNWCDSTINTQRTYKVLGLRGNKEEATYSFKAGIAAEGDEVSGRLINLEVNGGILEDAATGTNAANLGNAISAIDTRLTCNGIISKNCYSAINWIKRGGSTDMSWCRVSNCQFLFNKVTGAYMALGNAAGGADISYIGNVIVSNTSSFWSAVGAVTNQALKYSSGIVTDNFFNGSATLIGNQISGAQYGVWSVDSATINLEGNTISGSISAVATYGGGTLVANTNRFSITAGSVAVYRNTTNLAASASYDTYTYVSRNHISTFTDTTTDYAIQLTGNSSLWKETQVKNNTIIKGIINVTKGAATLFDLDDVMKNYVTRTLTVGLTGPDTFFTINMDKEFIPTFTYAQGTDAVSRAITEIVPNFSGVRGSVRFKLAGDVRSAYNATNNVAVTLLS